MLKRLVCAWLVARDVIGLDVATLAEMRRVRQWAKLRHRIAYADSDVLCCRERDDAIVALDALGTSDMVLIRHALRTRDARSLWYLAAEGQAIRTRAF